MSRDPAGFNCRTCPHRHCDRDGAIEGSNGPAGYPKWEIPGVIESDVCLLPMVDAFSRECLALYRHYRNGILIKAGGLYDQPRRYVLAMGIIDAYSNRGNPVSTDRQ